MSDYNELITVLIELLTNRFSPKPEFIRGILGDGQGNVVVPERPDKSYVRFNRGSTEFFEVFNRTVTPVNDWPVLIGELPWQPGLTQVVDTDWAAFEQSGWGDSLGSTSPHAPTHEWPDGSPGSDPVDVHLRSMVPLRTYSDGTIAYANAYEYEYQASGQVWGGLPGVDLGPVISSMITGTMRFMGIYLDPDENALGVVTGATTVFTSAFDPPRMSFPAGMLASSRVRVYGGQAEINEIDIRDVRQPFSLSAAAGWPFENIITVSKTDEDADYNTIQEAINNANTGDVIWLDAGTYNEQVHINRDIILAADPGSVTIYANEQYVIKITSAAKLFGINVINIRDSGANYGFWINYYPVELRYCKATAQGAGTTNYGYYIDTPGGWVWLWQCEGYAENATGADYAIYTNIVELGDRLYVFSGYYEGDTASLYVTVNDSVRLMGPNLVDGVAGGLGNARGYYHDSSYGLVMVDNLVINDNQLWLDDAGDAMIYASGTTMMFDAAGGLEASLDGDGLNIVGDVYLKGDNFPQFSRTVEYGNNPQEHFTDSSDDLAWTGWAAYTGFVTPSSQLYTTPSCFYVAHTVIAKAFRYRAIPGAQVNYMWCRALNTFYVYGGVMVDDGSDKGDGTGANNFANVCMYSPAPIGTAPYLVVRYREGGAAVTTIALTSAIVPIGQFHSFGIIYGFTTPWTSWSWGAYVATESGGSALIFWRAGPLSWTPSRQGLYWESISNGADKGVYFDWFRES